MKIVALVTIQVCAFFVCHTTADTGPRPKRTLKLFENFMDTMRTAFGPEPPDLPPPEVIAKIATLPYSNPYTYFPTIRMHIRPMEPVEKHIVYVKALPPSPSAPMLLKPNMNDVEIIRMIQPLVRRPKSNSANIHYEIIPITIPIPEVHAPVNQPPISGDREFENEDGAFSGIPWTMDALPPPVPTSKSFDSQDEHMVPWQLQALPPPVATKRPSWHPLLKTQTSNDDGVFFPMKKKLMVPANSEKESRVNFFHNKFRPSPLHSEISVQPSLELTAFGEADSVTVPPISNFRVRRRRIFEKKSNSKSRPKRDARANFQKHAESPLTKLGSGITSTVKSVVQMNDNFNVNVPPSDDDAPLSSFVFDEKIFAKAFSPPEKSVAVNDERRKSTINKYGRQDSMRSKLSGRAPLNPPLRLKKVDTPTIFDFGEYSDNEEANREENKPALSEKHKRRMNFSDDSVSIVKSHDILSDYPRHHEYIPVIRRPNSSRQLSDSNANTNKFASGKLPSSLSATSDDTKKQFNLRNARIPFSKQSDVSERRRPSNNFDFSFSSKDRLKKPQTNNFSKQNSKEPYDDLFGERLSDKDVNGRQYFDKFWKNNAEHAPNYDFGKTEKLHDFGTSDKKYDKPSHSDFENNYDKVSKFNNVPENEKEYKRQNSSYDNIEFFEPVVIDIDSEDPSENLFSKFRPKYKQKITPETEETYSNEPLRLPDSLHESVDFIKTKSAHPPTFDLMSEADEHSVIAMIDENKLGR